MSLVEPQNKILFPTPPPTPTPKLASVQSKQITRQKSFSLNLAASWEELFYPQQTTQSQHLGFGSKCFWVSQGCLR